MKWFFSKKNENLNYMEDTVKDTEEKEFKRFHETYKIISFAMTVGLVFPNPKTEYCRFLFIVLALLSIVPISIMILIDMYYSWLRRELTEVFRHSTVVGPFMAGFAKMFIMFYKRITSKQIIDEIESDYSDFNNRPESYKIIIRESVKNNLIYSEKLWTCTVMCCVMIFPGLATVLNLYNFIFLAEPTKYMVHDLNKPFSDPEDRFGTPYFEIMYVYMLYCSTMYVINFLGYDGFFGLSINHACLKMELFCKAMEDAMKLDDNSEIYRRIVGVIQDQNRLYRYVELIQETFNIWLGLILIATMIQVCSVMYHISEGHGFDLRYTVFILATIVHFYVPCHRASKIKDMSVETADLFYSSGWEAVHDEGIRKMLVFMIARAQKPIEIRVFNMKTYDMELFSSIMQTSYSPV